MFAAAGKEMVNGRGWRELAVDAQCDKCKSRFSWIVPNPLVLSVKRLALWELPDCGSHPGFVQHDDRVWYVLGINEYYCPVAKDTAAMR